MSQHLVNEKALRYMEYINRETGTRHHTTNEDEYQYDLLRAGDPRAAEEHVRILFSPLPGKVSVDPIRNCKYLTVASATLASRIAIDVGMEAERAYNISDLYIQKMDTMQTLDELRALNEDMFSFYTKEIAQLGKRNVFSKPIAECLDFIYNNLYRMITVNELAEVSCLSVGYLSSLFKKETGRTITDYITEKKMEAARNMLKYSDYSYAEISSILAFSSQSHFIRVFKKHVGETPKSYREKNYRFLNEGEKA